MKSLLTALIFAASCSAGDLDFAAFPTPAKVAPVERPLGAWAFDPATPGQLNYMRGST